MLQWAHVPIVAPATCSSWFREAGRRVRISRGQLCAGFKAGGKDGCQVGKDGYQIRKDGCQVGGTADRWDRTGDR